jgi:alpha-ketoglutarate-dependent taurine dioxygenase
MALTVEPLDAPLGARVTGIDLREPVDAEAFNAIHRAWLDYQVLVFPDQEFSAEDQVRFSEMFGELGLRKRKIARPEASDVLPGIMLISNIREDGKPIGSLPDGEMMFHSDGAYVEVPFKYTLLYGIDIPAIGGNTCFSNMYRVYETLPADLKQRLADCTVKHTYYAGTVQKERPSESLSGAWAHPVFIEHCETGRTALYVSRLLCSTIEEIHGDEGVEIMNRLIEHSERPEFIYEHVWSPGDFVMWDNRCVIHARTDFPDTARRLLRRTVVMGSTPAAASAIAA